MSATNPDPDTSSIDTPSVTPVPDEHMEAVERVHREGIDDSTLYVYRVRTDDDGVTSIKCPLLHGASVTILKIRSLLGEFAPLLVGVRLRYRGDISIQLRGSLADDPSVEPRLNRLSGIGTGTFAPDQCPDDHAAAVQTLTEKYHNDKFSVHGEPATNEQGVTEIHCPLSFQQGISVQAITTYLSEYSPLLDAVSFHYDGSFTLYLTGNHDE